jgi:pterin-4a-carbinolamine dehydratase
MANLEIAVTNHESRPIQDHDYRVAAAIDEAGWSSPVSS